MINYCNSHHHLNPVFWQNPKILQVMNFQQERRIKPNAKSQRNCLMEAENAELKNLTILCTTTSPSPSPLCFFLLFFLRLIHRYLNHKTNSGFTFSCLVTVSRSVNISQCHLIPTPSTDIDQHCILRAKTSREGDNIQSKFWNLK